MEILDSGKDKVKKICDSLKKQTLDPAKQEAKGIVDQAIKDAEKIVKRAKDEAKEIYEENRKKILQEKKAFQSSLNLASVQTMEVLRQEIEENLFNKQIARFFTQATLKEEVVAEFITVIVEALKKEGVDAPLEVMIPRSLSKTSVAAKLTQQVIEKIKGKELILSEITGGARVKLVHQHLVLEMSDQSLQTLFIKFIRDDFRALLFETKTS
jgi:V/A-type H+/Na+-transporting ATPase subunit E